MVTRLVTIRPREARDLACLEPLSSTEHARRCRDEFARGEGLTLLVAVDVDGIPVGKVHIDFEAKADARISPLPNPGVWMRKELAC